MDITDAIQKIATLSITASGAKDKLSILPIPCDPDGSYIIVKPDGDFEIRQPHIPRETSLHSVDQVAAFTRMATQEWACRPVVYYSETEVHVELSEVSARYTPEGSACVQMHVTPVLRLLQTFNNAPDNAWKSQKQFMTMLRIALADCIDPDTLKATLQALAAYETMQGERVQGMVTRNRESLGRELKAELKSAAGDIPETLLLQVRIYTDQALITKRPILCSIETDPNNGGRFALIPIADAIAVAVDHEMVDLGELLRSSINGTTKRFADSSNTPASVLERLPMPVPVFFGKHRAS